MMVVRHGRPSKAYLATLRKPVESDYEQMVQACLDAIIRGFTDVLVRTPYVLKYPKDFPKGILEIKYDDGSNVYRVKAKKLLRWLNENGHTDITMDVLKGQVIRFGIENAKWDKLFEEEEE